MYTIPGKLYTYAYRSGKLGLKNDVGLILGNDIGVNLGNYMGVILGITPHPPVLIHRSESTLPLVVMAVNNPLLL
jgi:hypothetical protein